MTSSQQPFRYTLYLAADGTPALPQELKRKLSVYHKVDITFTLHQQDSRLLERGVDSGELKAVAAVQKLPADIVEQVLSGEHAVDPDSTLGAALQGLTVQESRIS